MCRLVPPCMVPKPNHGTPQRAFRVLTDVASELRENGALDEEECFIDATFVMAKGGGSEIGPTKRGKGMKIMAIVDRHGLPLSVSTHAANHHEVRSATTFDLDDEAKRINGDRAYDYSPDEELRNDGRALCTPKRQSREQRQLTEGLKDRRIEPQCSRLVLSRCVEPAH